MNVNFAPSAFCSLLCSTYINLCRAKRMGLGIPMHCCGGRDGDGDGKCHMLDLGPKVKDEKGKHLQPELRGEASGGYAV